MLWAMAARGVARPISVMAAAKALAVLGHVDGLAGGADHLHPEALQHAVMGQVQGAVQGRLPAHGGQQGVRALLLDDLCHRLPGMGSM